MTVANISGGYARASRDLLIGSFDAPLIIDGKSAVFSTETGQSGTCTDAIYWLDESNGYGESDDIYEE